METLIRKSKKQERAALIKSARDMLDVAQKEERGLTDTEQKKNNGLMAEIDKLTDELNELDNPSHESDIRLEPGDQRSYDPKEVRGYTKKTLPELRNYIKSQDNTGIGITEPVSFGKYVRSLITGDWKNSQAERRLLGTGTGDSGGGYLVPEIISADIIEAALNATQVMAAGAVVYPMESRTLVVPKVLTMPSTQWKKENSKYTASLDTTFGAVTLTAHTLMSMVSLSVELAADGMNIEQVIEREIARSIALEVDRVCLSGSGTEPEPRGIEHTANILTQVLANPAVYADFSAAYFQVMAENYVPNSLIYDTTVMEDLDTQLQATTNAPMIPNPSWNLYQKYATNQIADSACI